MSPEEAKLLMQKGSITQQKIKQALITIASLETEHHEGQDGKISTRQATHWQTH